jgi:hypothetical protein
MAGGSGGFDPLHGSRPGWRGSATRVLAVLSGALLVAGIVGATVRPPRAAATRTFFSTRLGHLAVAPTTTTSTTTLPEPPTTTPGTCPGPQPAVDLPSTLFAATAPFVTDPYVKQGRIPPGQLVPGQLTAYTPVRLADTNDFVLGLVMTERQAFFDAGAAEAVDVTVYQYACPNGAAQQFQVRSSDLLATESPQPIPEFVAGAIGWASAGPDPFGEYEQASALASGDYWLEVYTGSATPVDGAFNAAVLRTESNYLTRWRANPATPAPTGPAATAQATIAKSGGSPPVCPAATRQLTLAQFNRLLPPAPAGYEALPDEAPGGPVSAASMASTFPVPSLLEANLAAQGFEGGYARYWVRRSTGEETAVRLLVFTCGTGDPGVDSSAVPSGASAFTVTDGVPGAVGQIQTSKDSYGRYPERILIPDGRLLIDVAFFSNTTSTSILEGLAQQAYEHADSELTAGAAGS